MLLLQPRLIDPGSRSWLPAHSTDQKTRGSSLFFSVMRSPTRTRASTQVSSVQPERRRTWRSFMLRRYRADDGTRTRNKLLGGQLPGQLGLVRGRLPGPR